MDVNEYLKLEEEMNQKIEAIKAEYREKLKKARNDILKKSKEKIKVKKVVILWSEMGSDIKNKEFETLNEASEYIKRESYERIDQNVEGYDKTKFIITFNDDETYTGQLDVKHPTKEDNDTDIKKHITDHMNFHLGLKRPAHMTKEKYEMYLNTYVQDKKEYQAFVDTYDLD